MIIDQTLQSVCEADDQVVLVEFYAADQVPTASGFDPVDALKLYSPVAGVSFAGEIYTQLVRDIGSMRRTTTEESNQCTVTLDNLSREASQFEFATGFEGLIMVVRLISRALSTALDESNYLFTGRCEKPTSGTRDTLQVTAKGILHSVDHEIPRRKFSPYDPDGRTPDDVEFQGFPYMPQVNAGTTVYSARVKRGGLLGFLGFKKTVTKTLQYSSFSDLDAERFVPIVLGRAQVAGVHLAYADIGTKIRMTTAFMEGAIESFDSYRTDDVRFAIAGTVHKRFGYPANLGPTPYEQIPVPVSSWIGNGYYARTAVFFCEATGTTVAEVDPAPHIIIVALGMRMTLPVAGVWTTVDSWDAAAGWSDNPAAHVRWVLTSPDFYRLDDEWLDDDSFTECYDYNDGLLFDTSFSDIIFAPGTAGFAGGDTELNRYYLSTGVATPEYFRFLKGELTAAETFYQTPWVQSYSTNIPQSTIDPGDIDPTDLPGESSWGLYFFLRRRYTSNVVVTEQMPLIDFLHSVLFPAARLYLTQDPRTGKLKLRNKKPADQAYATEEVTGTTFGLEDVSPWVADTRGFVVIDPNTAQSEVREVTAAVYPASQNSITISSTSETVVGFSGASGSTTPATATVTCTAPTPAVTKDLTLDGIPIYFTPGTVDTEATCAGFLRGAINGHPKLKSRYRADWTPGDDYLTVTALWGDLTLDSAVQQSHPAPLTDPASAPVLTAPSATGSLVAGRYLVTYTWENARGETLIAPIEEITISAPNKRITVASVTPPAGATAVCWYCSCGPNQIRLRKYLSNNGASHTIDLADLPRLDDPLKPDVNRTGAEILRVETVFSDRAETRSAASRSNVLRGTFKWKLGNKAKPINRVDVKFRDSSQDFRLVTLQLNDKVHQDKTKKINKIEINGQAIDNWHQAHRITSGLLAELRDADFFYEWESDKAALLLEEGDVVAITDDGAEVYNLPVRIEAIEYTENKGLVTASFTARRYFTTLYDDSVAERTAPIIIQADQGVDFA